MATSSGGSGGTSSSPANLLQIIAELDRELAEDSTNALAHDKRGNAYFQLKEYQRAVSDYTRALELDPQCAAAYLHRGQAFAALGYHQWAAADFSRAEELDLQKQHLVLPPQPVAYRPPKTKALIRAAAPSGRKVYHLRYWLFYAVLIGASILILPVTIIVAVATTPGSFNNGLAETLILLSLFLLALAAALVFGLWKIRLVIAPEGITYYGMGFRVYTPWWNIRGIGSMRLGGSRLVNGLLLGQPALEGLKLEDGMRQQWPVLETSGWLRLELKSLPVLRILAPLGGLSGRSVDEALNMRSYGSIIPISLFVQQWQHSEVAAMIARYAPQVFG